ncbi:glycosyltransferase family A protein [Nocardioides sp. BP30]|uniref:glycosyltransferase n=1 Tax=Nocardioides sp. BP30 TaxID=3036374 RepID=UPI0024689265|nr:glycosyltransferase family A protein [Nocardioides sp. BP30]WGL51407.1 glycosyltransferase family A protein [Nocardioides sp. BP30]
MRRIKQLHVIVPVHDEEHLLPRCLAAIGRAVEEVRRRPRAPAVDVTVVLDACTDDSALVARRAGVRTVRIAAREVGQARAAGVADAVARVGGGPPTAIWIANTDADSCVPASWLTAQLDLARDGFELMVGRVRPDRSELADEVVSLWWRRHRAPVRMPVHGANLGFSLAAYQRAGGYPAVGEHEDVALVRAAIDAGCRWTQAGPWVSTSGRLHGRVAGGFAGYLRTLAAEPDPA